MILDNLTNWQCYVDLNPGFAKAFEFLRRGDLSELPAGRHEVDGDRVFAIVARDEGKGRAGTKLEAHRNYTDIQFCLSGIEEIGWKSTSRCAEAEDFDHQKDLGFFGDQPESWITMQAGSFAIFFPDDAHAVLGGTGEIAKVIMKVAEAR